MSEALLELKDVKTHFPLGAGAVFHRTANIVRAVDGVTLSIAKGEVLGLVGESGCGKSTLARTILNLVPATEGAVILAGRNLSGLSAEELRAARADFQMIFQDPYASLNPRMTVHDTIAEAIEAHRTVPRAALDEEVASLLHRVGLAARFSRKYPHEFSGGQRQRIAIARALAVRPELIVADEPVSALDVSIQAQIINLLARLTRELGLTMIFISHDLAVVRHLSHRIAVMYLGKIVELGPAAELLQRPLHPYTRALVSAARLGQARGKRILLAGDPPSPVNPPPGCAFHPRCSYAIPECSKVVPPLEAFRAGHEAACIRVRQIIGTDDAV
ncbi:MAG: ABC transporter ATP-binding protein [Burkholderiales bacterium]